MYLQTNKFKVIILFKGDGIMLLNYAHRGASGYCPENTMAAFEKAVELGCDGIETDVQLTKDGILVLCHDERLDRTTNGTGFIAETNYSDIEKLDAGIKFGDEFKGVKVPVLDELLELVKKNNIMLNIEIKNSVIDYKNIEEMIIKRINDYDLKHKIIISSFNHYSLSRCRTIDNTIKLGALYECRIYQPGKYASELKLDAVHPGFYTLDEETIKEIKSKDMMINAWTVNEEKYMRMLIKAGVDGIITNYPDKLNKVIEEMM